MTKLLISVRDADEARLALQAGVDLIDVKEPNRGALGAADVSTWRAVVEAVGECVPLSAALGELREVHAGRHLHLPRGFSFAKLGLAGCAELADWPRRWAEIMGRLPAQTSPVAVVYADWRAAYAPQPEAVLSAGIAVGCRAVLVDTYHKHDGDLLSKWPLDELARFLNSAWQAGLTTVVAGGLTAMTLPQILQLRPDFVGLRGAVCRGDRQSALSLERLQIVASLVQRSTALSGGASANIANL
jgi:uncharacterized protein (UPF0264 family)